MKKHNQLHSAPFGMLYYLKDISKTYSNNIDTVILYTNGEHILALDIEHVLKMMLRAL